MKPYLSRLFSVSSEHGGASDKKKLHRKEGRLDYYQVFLGLVLPGDVLFVDLRVAEGYNTLFEYRFLHKEVCK